MSGLSKKYRVTKYGIKLICRNFGVKIYLEPLFRIDFMLEPSDYHHQVRTTYQVLSKKGLKCFAH